MSRSEVWETIGRLCLLASYVDRTSDIQDGSLKKIQTLFANTTEQVERLYSAEAELYLRYVAFGKLTELLTEIYWDVKQGDITRAQLRDRLLTEVPAALEPYLGAQSKVAIGYRITEEKIVQCLVVDKDAIKDAGGPALAAVARTGMIFNIAKRQSEKVVATAEDIHIREESDVAWNVEPYHMLDEVLRNLFGASKEQVLQVLKVFGMRG